MQLDGSTYKHKKKEDRQKNSVQHGHMSWRAPPPKLRKGDFVFVLLFSNNSLSSSGMPASYNSS